MVIRDGCLQTRCLLRLIPKHVKIVGLCRDRHGEPLSKLQRLYAVSPAPHVKDQSLTPSRKMEKKKKRNGP